MSSDDQSIKGPKPKADTFLERAQDDFVLHGRIDRSALGAKKQERRLHLRAFDYWHALHGGKPMPSFADLTAEGLLPFKRNCLLLEFLDGDITVRFCGTELAPLLGCVLKTGAPLSDAKITGFSGALEDRLRSPSGRQEAAEFEFVDDPVECRGILLPFSARGQTAEFMMIVVNHRQRSIGADEREKISLEEPETADAEDDEAFARLAAACRRAGNTVVHPGANTREGLYQALAEAYRFHIEASRDPSAYRRYLRQHNMRQQRRAPFTPALKLTFGGTYEKTRLTEYAAALSYAARHEVGPDNLSNFLQHEPGGIKGCVARERAHRRGEKSGKDTGTRESVVRKARELPPVSLDALTFEKEFSLVLVRAGDRGEKSIISVVDASDHMMERALNRALKQKD